MPTKTIRIVVDTEVPAIHLLNYQDYEVVETKQEGTFCMIKKIVEEKHPPLKD